MSISISFKNLKHSEEVSNRIELKAEKLKKFIIGNCEISWTCSQNDKDFFSEVTIFNKHQIYRADAKDENLYKTFDMVFKKLEKQITKKKEKVKNGLHKKKVDLVILDPEAAWEDHVEEHFDDVKKAI